MTVLAERAEIERKIEGRTICDALLEVAERHADQPAFTQEGETITLGRDTAAGAGRGGGVRGVGARSR